MERLNSSVVRKSFVDFEELRSAVYASLVQYLEEKGYLRILPFDVTYNPSATLNDIDREKVAAFVHVARERRGFPLPVGSSLETVLTHLDLISDNGRVSNAALLLFGKQPQRFFISSEIKCAQFYGNEVTKPIPSYQVYKGDVFQLVNQAVDFVISRVNATVGSRDKSVQVDVDYELPVAAVREAIVNAVAHRDYTDNGSVQVMLFRDRLEIWNPGVLPAGLTIAKLSKPHRSIPANTLLANPMYLTGYIERMGTGTGDIIRRCTEKGLKTPEFIQENDFKVIIWRAEQATEQATEQADKKILKLIQILEQPHTRAEVQALLNIKHRPTIIYNYLNPAIEGGYIVPSHPDNPTHPDQTYSLTDKGMALFKRKK